MRKYTLAKPASLTLVPAYSIPVPASTRTLNSLDFANVSWLINAKAQTITARAPGWPPIVIMGATSKTPWSEAWSQQVFEDALIAQIGFPVASATLVTPAPAPATSAAATVSVANSTPPATVAAAASTGP